MGFGLFIVLFAANSMIWGFLKISSNLVVLFGAPRLMYSDLNGFGPFLVPWLFFRTLAFAACILFLSWPCAVEDKWKWRMRIAGSRWRRAWHRRARVRCVVRVASVRPQHPRLERAGHRTGRRSTSWRMKTYKRFSDMPLPHFTAVDITGIEPAERAIATLRTSRSPTKATLRWIHCRLPTICA
jgi:hypothetical protein